MLPVQFAILGLASGGLYALMGLGLIIVHRASGAINFANGAIAVTAGYALVYLESKHVPTLLAVVLSVAVGLVLGVAIQALVMRPLRAASPLTKAIATLGVLVVLQSACQLKFGSNPELVPGFLPQAGFTVLGAHLTTDYVIILGIALVLSAGLWWVYRHTRFGLATAAVAENEEAVGALGWSGSLIARGNWALAGTLAALAGVLLAPVIGVSLPEMTDALLLPGLAAALFGGLSSFPLATLGALLIGIAQSELTLYGNAPVIRSFPDISDAVPFLVIIVILVLRGRSLPARDFVEAHLPSLGSGRVRLRYAVPAVVIMLLLIQVVLPVNWVIATTTCLIAGILLLSLVLLVGYAGQLSLAQLSIGGLGALATARLATSLGWPLPIAIVVGVLAAIPIGLVVGLPAVRTRGAALAVVTLGLATALNDLVFSTTSVTGGYAGINVGSPRLFGLNVGETAYPRRYSLFAFILFAVIALVICEPAPIWPWPAAHRGAQQRARRRVAGRQHGRREALCLRAVVDDRDGRQRAGRVPVPERDLRQLRPVPVRQLCRRGRHRRRRLRDGRGGGYRDRARRPRQPDCEQHRPGQLAYLHRRGAAAPHRDRESGWHRRQHARPARAAAASARAGRRQRQIAVGEVDLASYAGLSRRC